MMGASGDGDSFGDGLAAAARSIIADARRALADPDLSDAEAVHEVRKALKRWRALLRLLAHPLGEQADQMRAEARELMRALAGARDAQMCIRDRYETAPINSFAALTGWIWMIALSLW